MTVFLNVFLNFLQNFSTVSYKAVSYKKRVLAGEFQFFINFTDAFSMNLLPKQRKEFLIVDNHLFYKKKVYKKRGSKGSKS